MRILYSQSHTELLPVYGGLSLNCNLWIKVQIVWGVYFKSLFMNLRVERSLSTWSGAEMWNRALLFCLVLVLFSAAELGLAG